MYVCAYICVCICSGKERGGVFTWRQRGWLIRKSSLLANGFLERGRCHLTEKYHLPEPAHPVQCNAALCESTTVTALSSLLSPLSVFLSHCPQTLSLLPPDFSCTLSLILACGLSPRPSSLFAFFPSSFSFPRTLSHRQR